MAVTEFMLNSGGLWWQLCGSTWWTGSCLYNCKKLQPTNQYTFL